MDFFAVACKGDAAVLHDTDKALKACPACFPSDPEIFCRDCRHFTRAEGSAYGWCSSCSPHIKRVHATGGCSTYEARA